MKKVNRSITLISLIVVSLLILLAGQIYSLTTKAQGSFSCDDVTEIPKTECEALVALYNSTNGANWYNQANWLRTNTPCSWEQVECKDGHVIKLMRFHRLQGHLPSQLGDLTSLQELVIGQSYVSGNIPPELGNLTALRELYLSGNELDGSIPPELGNLTNLQSLSLDSNHLSGSLPPELGNLANLQKLSLAGNQLSGSLPSELGNLTDLQSLYLNFNQLNGSIPPELGKLTNLGGYL